MTDLDTALRDLRAQSAQGVSIRELGRRFGLEKSSAHRAAIGETYRHVANDNDAPAEAAS